jgi:hypothetical protein
METHSLRQLIVPFIRETLLEIRLLAHAHDKHQRQALPKTIAHLQELLRLLTGKESLASYLQSLDVLQYPTLADQLTEFASQMDAGIAEPPVAANRMTELLVDLLVCGSSQMEALLATQADEHIGREADHLHNIPSLLEHGDAALLDYYLDVERKSYLEQASHTAQRQYQPIWHELQQIRRSRNRIVRMWHKVYPRLKAYGNRQKRG